MKWMKCLPMLLLLVLCLCVLTGCGKQEEIAQPEAETSAELTYTAVMTPIREPEEQRLNPLAFAGEGFYASSYEKLAEGEIPEGVTPEYEGQFDVYGQKMYYVNQSGESKELHYSPLPAPEDPGNLKRFNSGSDLSALFPLSDGSLLAVENQYKSWYDGQEDLDSNSEEYWNHYRQESRYFLRLLDDDGQELSSAPLDWEAESENGYLDLYNAICDGEGQIYAASEQRVLVFSKDGKCLARIDMGNWVSDLVLLSDGRAAACTYGPKGMELAVLDAEKGSVAQRFTLDSYPERLVTGSGAYDFFYTSGVHFYGYRLADQRSDELLSWLDCGLSADQILMIRPEESGSFTALYLDQTGKFFVTLSQVSRESLPEKQVLTLGTLSPDQVSDAVLRFNRSHENVRIQIVDYSQYDSGEDFEADLTKLSTEIMAGNMPDLLCLNSLPYQQLAAKGLLEDLYPWLEQDPEIKREDYFENVLTAAEVGGKLCQVSPGFTILSLLGATSVVGEEPGWNYDELNAALASMPEGCTPLGPYIGRDEALMMCLFVDMESYVNWTDGTCDFENEDFCKLLRFCAQFPAEGNNDGDGESVVSRIASGKQMLMDVTISDFDEPTYNDQYFGGSCTYIGYPTRRGTGNILYLSDGYAMSADCADKKAGWEFLRHFLTPEYQREQYGLPLSKAVFDEKLEEAMKIEYQTDAEGHYLLDENGEKIPVSRGGMGFSDGSGVMVEFQLYGMTQEQADKLMAAINSADKAVDLNTRIYGIVREESAAFFAGQKSAEETARLIQSKVGLYLSEQH